MCPDSVDSDSDSDQEWELWEYIHDDGCCELAFFPSYQDEKRRGLDSGAKLLCRINARGYDDAMQKKYDYLGWGRYKPIPDVND